MPGRVSGDTLFAARKAAHPGSLTCRSRLRWSAIARIGAFQPMQLGQLNQKGANTAESAKCPENIQARA